MSVTWTGLRELSAELGALPGRLEDATGRVVQRAAETAYRRAAGEYEYASLRQGLLVRPTADPLEWEVRQRAPHGHLHEFGTVERFVSGGAARGRMTTTTRHLPSNPVLIRNAERARREMGEALEQLLKKPASLGLRHMESR